ncbi:MAG: hypothetical protein ACLFRP_00015 [Puniceicoccaceae bacterium]
MEGEEEILSFELLYGEDNYRALSLFLIFANDVIEGLNPSDETVKIDDSAALTYVSALAGDSYFPANGGFEKASPFKKAAGVFVWLIAENPFKSSASLGDIALRPHEIAAIIGFGLVKACLTGAQFTRRDGKRIILENPIQVSDHFFKDLIEASRGISPQQHFKTYSLLFESLAYQANPTAQYDDRI